MEQGQLNWVANFIWGIADDVLRDLYVRGKYRDVILPMTVLRRLAVPTVTCTPRMRGEARFLMALKPLSQSIRAAFVYGSLAKATDRATSDVDLMIISDSITYGEVFGVLERVTKTLGRQVNPTVYTAAEFSKRRRQESAFVTRVLERRRSGSSVASMTSQSPLDRLAGPGNVLSKEPPDANEFAGLVRSGLARLKDAEKASNSL
jgi:predicted nucleotidyltransferase